MTALTGHAVCGCVLDAAHVDGCALGAAETIAVEAADLAVSTGGHQLLAAVAVLVEAGILRDIPADGPDDMLFGLLDEWWQCGLIGPAGRPQWTVGGGS